MKILPLLFLVWSLALGAYAQDEKPAEAPSPPAEPTPAPAPAAVLPAPPAPKTTPSSARIVVEASGELPDPPAFYATEITTEVEVGAKFADSTSTLKVRLLQGDDPTLSLHTRGIDDIVSVAGDTLLSWSVRWDGEKKRYLELKLKPDPKRQPGSEHSFVVVMRSASHQLPATIQITNFAPTEATASLDQVITLNYADGVSGKVTEIKDFLPVATPDGTDPNRFQSTVGGVFRVGLERSSASPEEVELSLTSLVGKLAGANEKSMDFQLSATARISKAGAHIDLLRGNAAISSLPANPGYRLELVTVGKESIYRLVFPEPGEFPIQLDFVAGINNSAGENRVDFTVAGGAVVPISLSGLGKNIEFRSTEGQINPTPDDAEKTDTWLAFVPANGGVHLQWKSSRKVGEGRLFFSTIGQIEATVGAGLLRQQHDLEFRVLQGELKQLDLDLTGSGEVLSVEGSNITGWAVVDAADKTRRLEIKLSQPITDRTVLRVRTRTALDAPPVRTALVRLTPVGAVRHSGYLRLSNQGSVRLEPVSLDGLTQLAPDQFPGENIEARQVFAYRFPAVDHSLEIAVDRIQPEVSVAQVTVHRLAKTDRMLSSDIELDIREAPIREWDIGIPEDYSVVSVVGAAVSDYVPGSEATNGQRILKVLFTGEVSGRQLIQLHLEKNQAAAAGAWALPALTFPAAKSVRGDLGVIGEAGYRITAGEIEQLVEKPLSLFPKTIAGLQQAFRIRESNWTATMQVEVLEQSVQADVFHLHSLNDRIASSSVLINYLITGAPVSEWRIALPEGIENVDVDGRDVRISRRDEDSGNLIVSLQQPVMGLYQLLVTYEEDLNPADEKSTAVLRPGRVTPLDVQDERGYVQVVSPVQVGVTPTTESAGLLKLDALELPAELRLISQAPALGSWQYTERPFQLDLDVQWHEPGTTLQQVVDFAEVATRISADGELVTEALYYVRSRGQRSLSVRLPEGTRLWAASVSGRSVAARQSDDGLHIPLPGSADPNVPVEVKLRIGKPTEGGGSDHHPHINLPVLTVPTLKADWQIVGDDTQVLRAAGGNVAPPVSLRPGNGLAWLAKNALGSIALVAALCFAGLFLAGSKKATPTAPLWRTLFAVIAIGAAIGICLDLAGKAGLARPVTDANALRLSLPAINAGQIIELDVRVLSVWRSHVSVFGILLGLGGIAALARGIRRAKDKADRRSWLATGVLLIVVGLLLQANSAQIFLFLLTAVLGLGFLLPGLWRLWRALRDKWRARRGNKTAQPAAPVSLILAALLSLSATAVTSTARAEEIVPADSSVQKWQVEVGEKRVRGTVEMQLTGKVGDSFLLLAEPAVMTNLQANDKLVRVAKRTLPDRGLCYVAVLSAEGTHAAKFGFDLAVADFAKGFPSPTGPAALQRISVAVDRLDWQVLCPAAVRLFPAAPKADAEQSSADLLLAPGRPVQIVLRPKPRDVSQEETRFYVESDQLYLPGPGVIDGHHLLAIRPSQGEVSALSISVPAGLTVSSVEGPIASWQFDAEKGQLQLAIDPVQSQAFQVNVGTQRSLDPLPAEATLQPLRVVGAAGEVGQIGVAFGPDAQPEKVESEKLPTINPGDFNAALVENSRPGAVLHRVFRYGSSTADGGGGIDLRVAPVAPEVRVTSKQILSLGDERVVLSVQFAAEISRAGLFQLSLPLPEGFEVESLTGPALHHWSELADADGTRQVVLHLNGKTLGSQSFALTLTGAAPQLEAAGNASEWTVPHFQLNEAERHIGDLIVNATTGVRLRSISRQNASEIDPRSLGSNTPGALAFRLLQTDWTVVLGVEQLAPWITASVLHDVTLREGQTRTTLIADFEVRNASIRSLPIRLPLTDADEIKTVRASGAAVSDLVRVSPDSDLWELRFKRRVVGNVQARIEFDRREVRAEGGGEESLTPASFPEAGQVIYHFAVRSSGRLELALGEAEPPRGWQLADWASVPATLREAGVRTPPSLTLRAVTPELPLVLQVNRQTLAAALKLRVAAGTLTTILSPLGNRVTAVELTAEVIQPGSLSITLPEDGELFSIFVNNESVHSIRKGRDWSFHVMPGADQRHASVRFIYSAPAEDDDLDDLTLNSPPMNVPLENITWRVVAPLGYRLNDDDGDLQLREQSAWQSFDRNRYLSKARQQRDAYAQQAAQLLEQAGQYRQAGAQDRALWALNSVVNQYALDAATNEDARVQLENLQTQNAIVGLNTRRQRLYLDNPGDNDGLASAGAPSEQLKQGAAANPVLQDGDVNFLPQDVSQLMQGNTGEENAVLHRIGTRMVQQQRSAEPATQALTVTLPEEGTVYAFTRAVQVKENAPLELRLSFERVQPLSLWRFAALVALLAALGFVLVGARRRRPRLA